MGASQIMQYLLPGAVLILMLSVGMSLRPRELVASVRLLDWGAWGRLLAATFLVPPVLALLLGNLLPIDLPTTSGLFLVSVAPGAPLMTRNAARRGFDMTLAASYQVWGALLIPLMIPLLVAAAAKLYDREIWIPPLRLLAIIARQQFAPLLGGLILAQALPVFSRKAQRPLNLLGNFILTIAIAGFLWKLGPALKEAFPWVFVAALLLAVGCLAGALGLLRSRTAAAESLAVCNVNRHVGLALLLSTEHFHNHRAAIPALAAYAVCAPVVMLLFGRTARRSAPAASPN